MPNGKNGVNGPNAPLLVVRGPKSGLEHAVNRPLEAASSAMEIQQRLLIAAQLNVQVNLKFYRDRQGIVFSIFDFFWLTFTNTEYRMNIESGRGILVWIDHYQGSIDFNIVLYKGQ